MPIFLHLQQILIRILFRSILQNIRIHIFPAQDTLVVGAGTSGVEIAIELSKSRPTINPGNGDMPA